MPRNVKQRVSYWGGSKNSYCSRLLHFSVYYFRSRTFFGVLIVNKLQTWIIIDNKQAIINWNPFPVATLSKFREQSRARNERLFCSVGAPRLSQIQVSSEIFWLCTHAAVNEQCDTGNHFWLLAICILFMPKLLPLNILGSLTILSTTSGQRVSKSEKCTSEFNSTL